MSKEEGKKLAPRSALPTGKTIHDIVTDQTSTERKLVDEILNQHPAAATASKKRDQKRTSRVYRPVAGKNTYSVGSKASDDSSVLSSMTKRLTIVEERNRQLVHERLQKYQELESLRDEVQDLQTQISEMKAFLSDYGLVWIGNAHNSEPKTTMKSETDTKEFDFDTFVAQLSLLNTAAGEGTTLVEKTSTCAKLVHRTGIALSIYKDGLMLRRGPFRSYSQESAQSFITDVLDGYFPQEFKESYPDGVIFNVIDRRNETYNQDTDFTAFSGNGAAVGNESFKSFASLGNPDLQMSTKEFLKNLPQSVIREGQVIPIRDSISKRINSDDDNSSTTINVPSDNVIGNEVTTTLQVRLGDGKKTLVIKLSASDTIAKLRKFIDQHEGGCYELQTNFPKRLYVNHSQTLSDAQLFPSATMFVKKM